ncbi:type II toxin-antitoxin system Phd/YefM family antitoxin [bacterium]|nr:type II toxin-antitoxin system Phd/YefM family antitoxin [bacterium]
MKSVQVGVFKSEFSDILQQVKENGESFIIEYGKNHKKVAMLVPYKECLEHQKPRIFGYMKNRGSYELQDDFYMTDDEFLGHE